MSEEKNNGLFGKNEPIDLGSDAPFPELPDFPDSDFDAIFGTAEKKDETMTESAEIENVLLEFKEEMLKEDPEEIFEKAYKISIITEIFDVLFDAYEFSPYETEIVLKFKGNILEQVYDEWLKHEDGFRSEITECISIRLLHRFIKLRILTGIRK